MASMRHLIAIIAAAVSIAAWAAPSVALAHDGHSHYAPAVVETSAIAVTTTSTEVSKDTQFELSFTAFEILSRSESSGAGCVGGCCGSTAGMACCGGALVPFVIETPPIRLSTLVDFDHLLPVSGIPPEALPKPPKSFA